MTEITAERRAGLIAAALVGSIAAAELPARAEALGQAPHDVPTITASSSGFFVWVGHGNNGIKGWGATLAEALGPILNPALTPSPVEARARLLQSLRGTDLRLARIAFGDAP